jgi:hypothetical protein
MNKWPVNGNGREVDNLNTAGVLVITVWDTIFEFVRRFP